MRLVQLSNQELVVRAIAPEGDVTTDAGLQAWHEDHERYRWGEVQRINDRLAGGLITPEQWLSGMDDILLEGHSNAWWIGRGFAGDLSDFNDDDLLIGAAFRDADADYLFGFYEDIKNGRYLDEEGNWRLKMMHARSRLYVGKMRGTANESFVENSPDDALWYWELGAVEEHCEECPSYVEIFNGVPKDQLFTTPGSCDTPCLGLCQCSLRSVAGDVSRVGPGPLLLLYENEDFNNDEIAA